MNEGWLDEHVYVQMPSVNRLLGVDGPWEAALLVKVVYR